MDIGAAATILSVSRKGLRNMLARGMVPGGRKVMAGRLAIWEIDPDELERYRLTMARNADAPTRFWRKVTKTETCWLWTAAKQHSGHGAFMDRRGHLVRAHRWSWEQVNGPIPEGLVLDHLCGTPACVRPDHLEPVTQGENVRRGGAHAAAAFAHLAVTHCPRGHEYTPENTQTIDGKRSCRACKRAYDRRRRAR